MSDLFDGSPLDFNALRKQADFIERPESRIGLADRGYTAYLLRWAAERIDEGCTHCNERGLGYA